LVRFRAGSKKTKRVSLKKGGGGPNKSSYDPSISAAGRFVAFSSAASDLIGNDGNSKADIFRRGPLR
jgi:TolB protein